MLLDQFETPWHETAGDVGDDVGCEDVEVVVPEGPEQALTENALSESRSYTGGSLSYLRSIRLRPCEQVPRLQPMKPVQRINIQEPLFSLLLAFFTCQMYLGGS